VLRWCVDAFVRSCLCVCAHFAYSRVQLRHNFVRVPFLGQRIVDIL
jgi:hypothetical protein